jgi:hypothetical protein
LPVFLIAIIVTIQGRINVGAAGLLGMVTPFGLPSLTKRTLG